MKTTELKKNKCVNCCEGDTDKIWCEKCRKIRVEETSEDHISFLESFIQRKDAQCYNQTRPKANA